MILATSWTVAHQATLPQHFPGKTTAVGCHFLPPNPGLKPGSPELQTDSLPNEPLSSKVK